MPAGGDSHLPAIVPDGQPMVGALFKVCQRAVEADPQKPGEARAFFEQNFRPVRISPLGTPDGFITGYYEPLLTGRQMRPATHTVHVGDGASRLRLPAGARPSPH